MTKTFSLAGAIATGAIIALSLFVSIQPVSAASTLFGDAAMVSGGNPGDAVQLRSDTSVSPGYGGVRFDDASGLLFPALTTLSADFNITDDSCGGGSPRIQIQIDTNNDTVSDGNVFVALGPSPGFSGCVTGWQNTGNLIGNTDAGRYDYGQFGGSAFTTYAGAPANVLAGKVLKISVVVDGSWSTAATGGDSEQTTLIDNVVINSTTYTFPPPPPVTVTIHKYVDGAHANATNAEGLSFPMQSSWNAINIGAGSGSYALAPATYDAQTSSMSSGANYSTNENTSGSSVGASCADGKPFALVGYSWGDSEVSAASMPATTTSPAFVGITTNKHVIVWNKDCTPKLTVTKVVINDNGGTAAISNFILFIDGATTTSGTATTSTVGTHVVSETANSTYTATFGGDCNAGGTVTLAAGDNKTCTITNNDNAPDVTVTIVKYIGGVHATAGNANSASFPMQSSWNAINLGGAGSGTYPLSTVGFNTPNAYEAVTSNMTSGSSYATNENLTTTVVGPNCSGGQQFRHAGYTSGGSLAAAQAGTLSSTSPAFTNITSNKFVIVWNEPCPILPPAPPANACSTPTVAPSGYTLQNGTAGSDTVTIAPQTMFVGKGGNDTVTGPDGNYIICTGNGNDTITLGHGDYTVHAGKGNNSITTGNGAGPITTGAGNDIITTGNGAHTILAGAGNNTITTGNGVQNITTLAGNDKVTTGSGADTIAVGGGNNTVTSGAGSDTITAGAGNDNLNGGADADTCSAGGGSNILTSCNP